MMHEKDTSFFSSPQQRLQLAVGSRFRFLADGAKKRDPGKMLRESDLVHLKIKCVRFIEELRSLTFISNRKQRLLTCA